VCLQLTQLAEVAEIAISSEVLSLSVREAFIEVG
jgi:hypothetical protein